MLVINFEIIYENLVVLVCVNDFVKCLEFSYFILWFCRGYLRNI